MEIFHAHVQADTKDVVHRFAELHILVRELCHTFKVQVLTHNRKTFTEQEDYLNNRTSATDEYKHNNLKRSARIMLAHPSGVPFGVAFICNVNNKGNEELGYAFMAPFTQKNRGRGEDRYARRSTNLSTLIKTIKKEKAPSEHVAFEAYHVRESYQALEKAVEDSAKIPWRSPDVCRETLVALLDYYLHNKMITDPSSLKEIDKAKALDDEIKQKRGEMQDLLNRYKKDMHIVARFTQSPLLTVGRLTYNAEKGIYELVHGSLKCYSSAAELPTDLMLTYKMWRIKHERQMDFKTDAFFPSMRRDAYCSDFDVYINSDTHNGFGNINAFFSFITPVADSEANGN